MMDDLLVAEPVAAPLPLPVVAVRVRAGVPEDIAFMDELQKKHTRQVGWMPTAQFEGKIRSNHVLIAEVARDEETERRRDEAGGDRAHSVSSSLGLSVSSTPLGYLIGNDQYFKRDDVGIIYQINVAPVAQRGLIGATLLKAQIDRSAWGCKLYCCWCAQDIAANHFWKAMGFVPLAFRTGSAKKDRVHIFWQKRIRAGDEETPWWFPSQTSGGSIRANRIVLPIPPGKEWHDEMPRILPESEAPALPAPKRERRKKTEPAPAPVVPARRGFGLTGLRVGPAPEPAPFAPAVENPAPIEPAPMKSVKPKRTAAKNDPKMVAAARELRDRWLEAVNRGEFIALPEAKYDVARWIGADDPAAPAFSPMLPLIGPETKAA